MSSGCCKRVKNACMVCRKTVTTKNGLQCQGSCGAWIHFTCCSYTPGKVKDIRAKIIKVRCPCPDCTPPVLKEQDMRDEPFCCPSTKDGIPKCTTNMQKCTHDKCAANKASNKCAPKAPMNDSQGCEKASSGCTREVSPTSSPTPSSCLRFSPGCNKPPCQQPCPQPCQQPYQPPCQPQEPCMPSISVVENMCDTVGLLSTQLNQLMGKMTSALNTPPKAGSPCYCPKNPKRC